MTITTFDRQTCNSFIEEAIVALGNLAAKHGVTLRQAGGSYGGGQMTMKIEAKVADTAAAADHAQAKFDAQCRLYGLVSTDFGANFSYNGKRWELVGFEPTRPKYCVRAKQLGTSETKLLTRSALPIIIAARGTSRVAASPAASRTAVMDASAPAAIF